MGKINELTDEELLNLYLQKQSDSYFRVLYGRYIDKVYSKAISLLKDEALAEDAVQEIFLKIFLNIPQFTFRSKFSTWVYSISYNYCIDLLRKRKKYNSLFAEETDNVGDVGAEMLNDKLLLEMKFQQLGRVLEHIPLEDKTVLVMKYKDGMGIRDISQVIGKSESAVKMKLKRAKAKAQKAYDQLFPEEIN